MKPGTLTVYTGPMYSGKSSALVRKAKELAHAGVSFKAFVPEHDNRTEEDKFTTHAGPTRVPVERLKTITELRIRYNDTAFVLIDEITLFKESPYAVFNCIQRLMLLGVHVHVAGLDLDRYGQPFGCMPNLLCLADYVHKLCGKCSEPGCTVGTSRTFMEGQGQARGKSQILVDSNDGKYKAYCTAHFNERLKAEAQREAYTNDSDFTFP